MRRLRWNARQQRHLDNLGRVFLSHEKMRAIRWEEALARAQARRDGITDFKVVHRTFHCHLECVAVPIVVPLGRRPKRRRR